MYIKSLSHGWYPPHMKENVINLCIKVFLKSSGHEELFRRSARQVCAVLSLSSLLQVCAILHFSFSRRLNARGMCFVTFEFFQKTSATGMFSLSLSRKPVLLLCYLWVCPEDQCYCCVTLEFVQKTSATAVLPLSLSRIPVLQEHVCVLVIPFAIGKCWVTFCYR